MPALPRLSAFKYEIAPKLPWREERGLETGQETRPPLSRLLWPPLSAASLSDCSWNSCAGCVNPWHRRTSLAQTECTGVFSAPVEPPEARLKSGLASFFLVQPSEHICASVAGNRPHHHRIKVESMGKSTPAIEALFTYPAWRHGEEARHFSIID